MRGLGAGRPGPSARPPWPRSVTAHVRTSLVVCSLASGSSGSQGEACNAWAWSTSVLPVGPSLDTLVCHQPPLPRHQAVPRSSSWLSLWQEPWGGCHPSGWPVGPFAAAAGRPHEARPSETWGQLTACDRVTHVSVCPSNRLVVGASCILCCMQAMDRRTALPTVPRVDAQVRPPPSPLPWGLPPATCKGPLCPLCSGDTLRLTSESGASGRLFLSRSLARQLDTALRQVVLPGDQPPLASSFRWNSKTGGPEG